MCKKTIMREFPIRWLLGAVLVCSGARPGAAADPSLVGWWQLNEAGGTVAADSSGNGNDATLAGKAVFTSGLYGRGVYCDGTEAYVAIPNVLTPTCTVAFWFKPNWDGSSPSDYRLFDASAGDKYFFISKGSVHDIMTPAYFGFFFEDSADTDFQNVRITAAGNIAAGTWYHVAVTWQFGGGAAIVYLNGQEISRATGLGTFATLATNPRFGYPTGAGGVTATNGAAAVFDDIKIFNRVLTAEEIPGLMTGAALEQASAPSPADQATDVLRDAALSWEPGIYAATHDVYLGTTFEDVNSAGRTAPAGLLVSEGQDATSYEPPGHLELGQTYFWRVDEVNAAPDYTVFPGPVWSFTVEPYSYPVTGITATASSEDRATMGPERTVDGSGLDPDTDGHSVTGTDMWLSNKKGEQPTWIQYAFARPEKLDKMAVWNSNQIVESSVGLGARLVTVEYSLDGVAWTALGDFEFAQAPGEADYQANTDVPFGGVMAQYVKLTIQSNWGELLPQYGLSEVRFYALPVQARQPSPATGATAVNPQVDLSWRAGREAATHEVYLGEDQQAVVEGTASAATVSAPEYEASLLLSKDYYWKVIEVNEAETPSNWDSEVWSFTTNDFVVVDDFESYTDEEDVGRRIYETWIDGWDDPSNNGGVVGYSDPPFAEQEVLHGGQQSMPLSYDNGSGAVYSEATRTFASAQDWTQHGITTLVVYFRGLSANSPAPLYVKINNTKVVFNNGAAATTFPVWKQWDIPLAGTGANLQSVKSLTIGIGDGQAGGTGMLYVDDLRLYATAPAVVSPVDPGTTGLVAYYAMEGNVQDGSGKNNHGTASGDTLYDTGVVGQALSFNGTNTYVDLPIGTALSTMSDVTVATYVYFENTGGSWQRIFDFGTGTTNYMFLTPRQGTGGPIRFAIRTATVGEQGVNAPTMVPSGWHHVAVVIESATMTIQLYLDGELVGSGATTLLPKDMGVTTQNWLGRSQWTADAYLTGSLDEFRIFTRALSAAEVRYLAGDR
jgi:hypothetical protein